MRRNSIAALALTALLGATLASTLAWSRPKPGHGCPRHVPENGSPCKHEQAQCRWRCEGEDHYDNICSCDKDEQGAWRWHCAAIGPCKL